MVDWLYLKFWIPKAQLPWWNEKRKTRQHLYWWWAHISFGSNTRKKTMTCECKCDVTHEFAVEYIKKAHTKTENKHEIKSILHKVASMKSSKNSNEIVLHVLFFFFSVWLWKQRLDLSLIDLFNLKFTLLIFAWMGQLIENVLELFGKSKFTFKIICCCWWLYHLKWSKQWLSYLQRLY